MKNPLAVFTSVAAVAAAAVGGTVYMNRLPQVPQPVAAKIEQAQTAEKAPEIKVVEPAAEAKVAEAAPAEVPKVAEVAPVDAPKVAEAAPADAPKAAEAAPVEAPKLAEAAPAEVPKPADAAPAEAPKVADAAPADAPQVVEVAPAVDPAVAPKTAETEVAVAAPKVEAPAAAAAVAEAPAAAVPALPSFDTVRVEKTGDAVIAGRAEPDSEVTVKWNGNIVGATKANADGSFVLIPAKPLATGIGAMTIEMAKGGAIIKSEGSVFVVVQKDAPAMVAKVDPVAPTDVVQPATEAGASDLVQLTAVDYDLKGNIVFSGRATPGSAVRFYVDNNTMGEGRADATGSWRFEGNNGVTAGTHTLRADAVDAEGKVTSRIELPFLREDAETVAAAIVAKLEAKKNETVVTRSVVADAAPAVEAAGTAPAVEPAPAPKAVAAAETAPASPAETKVAAADPTAPAAEAPAELTAQVGPRTLVIQPGNNLWKLSREVYGKGRMYTIIYKANKGQIRNPNRIYPGQILTAPAGE